MIKAYLFLLICLLAPFLLPAQVIKAGEIRRNVPLDSILLSDPFVQADHKTNIYQMTGTGGMLWKSKDLRYWEGQYKAANTDPKSWVGPRLMIWADAIHAYKNKLS